MVNNAGLMPLSPLEMERFDVWDQAIDVNIKGVLWGIAAALPHFKERKSGQFINVLSVAGHTISPGGAIYSATKYSVRVISEALRQEVKPYDIRTTVISPGAVDTELPSSVKAEGVAGPIADYYQQNAIPADSFAPVRAVRHRPAGRRRRQRDPVPPDEAAALTRISPLVPVRRPLKARRGASHRSAQPAADRLARAVRRQLPRRRRDGPVRTDAVPRSQLREPAARGAHR
jgi:NAD(P)-dependent dehydrogenase (short-subunit alcohol dehydrogenase family)